MTRRVTVPFGSAVLRIADISAVQVSQRGGMGDGDYAVEVMLRGGQFFVERGRSQSSANARAKTITDAMEGNDSHG